MQTETAVAKLLSPATRRGWPKGFVAGILGITVGGAVSYLLLALVGPATIYNDALQSAKLQAVWSELEPLPLITSNLALFGIVFALLGGIHGLVFAAIKDGLPVGMVRRGMAFGLIVWLLGYLMFEVSGPWNLLGEPVLLVAVELAVALPGALLEGIIISAIYGKTD